VQSPRHFLERVLPLLILALACVSAPLLIASETGLPRLKKLRGERAEVQDKVSELAEEIRKLRAQASQIKSDPAVVEQAARDELGLVRQTEVVFQFDP
jgi:cell division protein FtsB